MGKEYRRTSLVELLRALSVSEVRDVRALHELHGNRRVFVWAGCQRLLLPEFLEQLRQQIEDRTTASSLPHAVVEEAYDHTIAKFSNFKSLVGANEEGEYSGVKFAGVDCRHYYRALLKLLENESLGVHLSTELREESVAAIVFQRFVIKQFWRSVREAQRNADPAFSRYVWRLPEGSLTLWMPKALKQRERPAWLEKNVKEVDLRRSGELERVQTFIDECWGRNGRVPFEEIAEVLGEPPELLMEATEGAVPVAGFASALATEKSSNIGRLQPAIRVLGKGRVRQLVQRIVKDVVEGHYSQAKVATDFGLSEGTLSRFAGQKWNDRSIGGLAIPVLWRNLAAVISRNDNFVQAARNAGVWENVRRVVDTEV